MSMTGVCPMCQYTAPTQNSFKPNAMSEYYILNTKETVIANDNAEELEHPTKGIMVRKDVYLKREHEKTVGHQTLQAPVPTPVKAQTPPPPATIRTPAPTSVPQTKPTIVPARPIPASAIKTPAEVASTPKSAVTAAPVVETPLVANTIPTTEGQP